MKRKYISPSSNHLKLLQEMKNNVYDMRIWKRDNNNVVADLTEIVKASSMKNELQGYGMCVQPSSTQSKYTCTKENKKRILRRNLIKGNI